MRDLWRLGAVAMAAVLSQAWVAYPQDGGSISGTVTNESGKALSGICVGALGSDDLEIVAETRTDESGRYTLALPAGTYVVGFEDCNEQPQYALEFYDDKPDPFRADRVAVQEGQETAGIDAVLDFTGSISGTVRNTTGQGIASVCVYAFDASGAVSFHFALTDEMGAYRIDQLRAGGYKVSFVDCSEYSSSTDECTEGSLYGSEWYSDRQTFEDADVVNVLPAEVTAGIDAVLEPGPTPDLAVTAVSVEGVPLPAVGDPGDVNPDRRIHVTIENKGAASSSRFATLFVFVCGETAGCTYVNFQDAFNWIDPLPPGGSTERVVEWNAAGSGSMGDLTVYAEVRAGTDADCTDNVGTTSTAFGIRGTGYGVSVFPEAVL